MAKIDAINQKILQELGRNARLSNLDLADRVGLSPSACLRRVQELERSKVITGYRVTTDRAKMGIGFVAYMTVGLSVHTKASQEAFESSISRATEVVEDHPVGVLLHCDAAEEDPRCQNGRADHRDTNRVVLADLRPDRTEDSLHGGSQRIASFRPIQLNPSNAAVAFVANSVERSVQVDRHAPILGLLMSGSPSENSTSERLANPKVLPAILSRRDS